MKDRSRSCCVETIEAANPGTQIGLRPGFTLIELLVVIAIIGVLAAMLLPVLARTKSHAVSTSCLNNLKQLQMCWHMYAMDNSDIIPPNNFVYTAGEMGTSNSPTLGEDGLSWCHNLAAFDTNDITDANSVLFLYNRNAAIYHCPADYSTVEGYPNVLRKRSYNDSNSANCEMAGGYRLYTSVPSADTLFVFIDTHEDEIWDSTFGVIVPQWYWGYGNYWLDVPADRHDQGANLTFADGHAEHWKWQAPKYGWEFCNAAYSAGDLADLQRLQYHYVGNGGN